MKKREKGREGESGKGLYFNSISNKNRTQEKIVDKLKK